MFLFFFKFSNFVGNFNRSLSTVRVTVRSKFCPLKNNNNPKNQVLCNTMVHLLHSVLQHYRISFRKKVTFMEQSTSRTATSEDDLWGCTHRCVLFRGKVLPPDTLDLLYFLELNGPLAPSGTLSATCVTSGGCCSGCHTVSQSLGF